MSKYLDLEGLALIVNYFKKQMGQTPEGYDTIIDYVDSLKNQTAVGVKVGNETLVPSSGVVQIPLATQEKLGLVASSNKENEISVNEDGTMTVNSLSLDKIIQADGDELILEYKE